MTSLSDGVIHGEVVAKEPSAANLSEGVIRGVLVQRSHPQRACLKESSVASLYKGVIRGELVQRSRPVEVVSKESSGGRSLEGVIREGRSPRRGRSRPWRGPLSQVSLKTTARSSMKMYLQLLVLIWQIARFSIPQELLADL